MPLSEDKYDPTRPVYLRIGDWHSSETSRNYATGDIEAGVSVYDLLPDGSIVIPEGEWSAHDLASRLASGEPRYLVQGDWISCGHEEEPLLRTITKIGSWPDDVPDNCLTSVSGAEGLEILSVKDALDALAASKGPLI